MDGHFSNLLHLLKCSQKYDSFAAHFDHHFNSTTSHTDLSTCTTFIVVKKFNPIGAMKTFTRPICNLCTDKLLTILKKIRDKRVMLMKNYLEIYGSCQQKSVFRRCCLSTDDPV